MLTFERFSGIDNQHRSSELMLDGKTRSCALTRAMNIDLDLEGRPARRSGVTQADTGIWRNLWEGSALTLATKDGDLVNVDTAEVLYPTLSGTPRTWFDEWPDGRVAFSNGLIRGITDGTAAGTTAWGVPIPAGVGGVTKLAGDLFPGRYIYAVTHVRTADSLEGGPAYGGAFDLAVGEGSILWTGLPAAPAGHTTNVYLTSHNDDVLYLAASTANTTASFSGKNEDLQVRMRTGNWEPGAAGYPAPAGICLGNWRGRSLLASGSLLIASRSQQWELFDLARDVKQFPADVTMNAPVEGGIWVGTERELAFLAGTEFDKLSARHEVIRGAVALGSAVMVDGKHIGTGAKQGYAWICITDGYPVALFADGTYSVLAGRAYKATGTEYVATFRMVGEIPQYVAIEQ